MSTSNSIEQKIIKGTIVIVLVGALGKLAAFISEAVLAAFLGTTSQSDAYYMVWGVHAVIYPMLSIGIWQVFLPLYKSHIAKGETNTAFLLANKTTTFFSLVSIGVVALLFIFAPFVVLVIAPGFKGDTRELCIELVRISSPQYIFIIASAVYASMLQCHNKFFGSQIRELVSYIPPIIAAACFYRHFGINSIAISLVIASILRLAVELPFVDWGYKFTPDYHFKTSEFELMLKRLPSALISAGVTQINTLVDRAMASTLSTGTVSGLNYGHKLMNVFSGFISAAISTALYPQMVELIALDKKDELSKLIIKIINIYSLLMFPITLACILFRTELVAAVFQHGAFDESSTKITAGIFALYCVGIFFIACNTVVSNIFYGYGDTKTPMIVSVENLFINVGLNIILIQFWGANGLAFATSLSAAITLIIRIVKVKQYINLDITKILVTGFKVCIASAFACVPPRLFFNHYTFNIFFVLIVSAIIGVFIYLCIVKLLKIDELNELLNMLKSKIKHS